MDRSKKLSTKAIHEGEEPDFSGSGDVVVPIHLSTTYARKELEVPTRGFEYSRSGNPTRMALEKKLASLENATYGLAFASGLAAETSLILALCRQGDKIVASDDLYGGTRRLMQKVFAPFGVESVFVDATDNSRIEEAIDDRVKMVWLESPTNPMLKLSDIQGVAKICKAWNKILVVDNTFMSPAFQLPLDLGATISLHSTTKYIGGHSDVVGGAIMLNSEELYEKIKFVQNAAGGIPAPFDCYMTARGIKTLALRMQQHQHNALRIAEFLQHHAKVEKVIYPGLRSHPQYELASNQMSGFGGIVTFILKGGYNESKRMLEKCRIFSLAESLGGVESLIEHPASMTHASVPAEVRQSIGIDDGLVRISAGIEDVEDLLEDLDQALR
jgi:cystathionine gamma-lyase